MAVQRLKHVGGRLQRDDCAVVGLNAVYSVYCTEYGIHKIQYNIYMSCVSYRGLKVWVLRIQLFGTSFSGIGSATGRSCDICSSIIDIADVACERYG